MVQEGFVFFFFFFKLRGEGCKMIVMMIVGNEHEKYLSMENWLQCMMKWMKGEPAMWANNGYVSVVTGKWEWVRRKERGERRSRGGTYYAMNLAKPFFSFVLSLSLSLLMSWESFSFIFAAVYINTHKELEQGLSLSLPHLIVLKLCVKRSIFIIHMQFNIQ